jgi:hypothetical protein
MNTMAQTFGRIADTLDRGQTVPPVAGARTKARPPDVFNGSDPEKLEQFLFQCRLFFRASPAQFTSETTKVNYALTFLSDTPLRWFQTALDQADMYGIMHAWLDDFDEFSRELRTNFGTADPIGEAAELLDALRMKYNDKITTYNVEFLRLSAKLSWGDAVLCHRYYRGLPDRIQDALSTRPDGKPTTFEEMRIAAQIIDTRFWERQREKTRAKQVAESAAATVNRKSGNQSQNQNQKTTSPSTTNQQSNSNSSKPNNSNNNSSNNNNNRNKGKPPASQSSPSSFKPKPDLSDKLKDGKLTTEERQRRIDNKLCLFCGAAGHRVSECRKRAASSARKAQLKDTDNSQPSAKASPNPPKGSEK